MAEFKEHFWRHRQQTVAGLIQHAAEKARSVPTSRLTPSPNPYMLPIYFRVLLHAGALDGDVITNLLNAALEGVRR